MPIKFWQIKAFLPYFLMLDESGAVLLAALEERAFLGAFPPLSERGVVLSFTI